MRGLCVQGARESRWKPCRGGPPTTIVQIQLLLCHTLDFGSSLRGNSDHLRRRGLVGKRQEMQTLNPHYGRWRDRTSSSRQLVTFARSINCEASNLIHIAARRIRRGCSHVVNLTLVAPGYFQSTGRGTLCQIRARVLIRCRVSSDRCCPAIVCRVLGQIVNGHRCRGIADERSRRWKPWTIRVAVGLQRALESVSLYRDGITAGSCRSNPCHIQRVGSGV